MSRPASINDLAEHQRRPHQLVSVSSKFAFEHPAVGLHLMAAFAAAEEHGLIVEAGEIGIPLSDDELTQKLQNEQSSWDRGRADYQKWTNEGVWPTYPWVMQAYCRQEGLEVPTKPEEES